MPFHFNPNEYTNKFAGEIVGSDIMQSQNGNEFWSVVIAHLTKNNRGEWDKVEGSCPFENCNVMVKHYHNTLWESDRPGSPAHKFIISLKDNGRFIATDAKSVLGKRFTWEEEIWQGRPNPNNPGAQGKDRRYYFVAGPMPTEDEEITDVQPPDETIPFDTGQGVEQVPVNGALTQDDKDRILASLVDGKDLGQARVAVREIPELYNDVQYRIGVLQGSAFDRLKSKNLVTQDDQGVYHAVK